MQAVNMTNSWSLEGYSRQVSEGREPQMFPHELATLNDVLLLSPHGFFRLNKIPPDCDVANQVHLLETANSEMTDTFVMQAKTDGKESETTVKVSVVRRTQGRRNAIQSQGVS